MATRRRASARSRTSRARKTGSSLGARFTPDVVRSIVGLILLILGAMTLIALILPGQGSLTSWWTGTFAPWFGTMRWLLPFFLLVAGWWLEFGPGSRPGSGWGITLVGMAIAYVGIVGAAQVLGVSGGTIGRFMASNLSTLLTAPGAFVILVGMAVGGLALAFGLELKKLIHPVTESA